MKLKTTIILSAMILPVALIFMSNSGGAIAGVSGSVGDGGAKCTGCHNDAVDANPFKTTLSLTDAQIISTNIPIGGYVPLQTYQITIGSNGVNMAVVAFKYGFQLSAENSLGTKKGTFIPASDTKLAGSNITHNGAFIGSTPEWVFNWTAPASGTGNVVFTTAIIAANGSGSSGDKILTATISIAENLSSSVQNAELADFSVFPNPLNENFVLNYSLQNTDMVVVSIFDMNGKEITKLVNENQAAGNYHLMLSPEVEAGTYILKVSAGDKLSYQKLFIK
jgi:hypothetical protein